MLMHNHSQGVLLADLGRWKSLLVNFVSMVVACFVLSACESVSGPNLPCNGATECDCSAIPATLVLSKFEVQSSENQGAFVFPKDKFDLVFAVSLEDNYICGTYYEGSGKVDFVATVFGQTLEAATISTEFDYGKEVSVFVTIEMPEIATATVDYAHIRLTISDGILTLSDEKEIGVYMTPALFYQDTTSLELFMAEINENIQIPSCLEVSSPAPFKYTDVGTNLSTQLGVVNGCTWTVDNQEFDGCAIDLVFATPGTREVTLAVDYDPIFLETGATFTVQDYCER